MLETRDIIDIQQLEAFCHHAVDHDDQSLFHLAFTEDARFDGRLCGGPLCVGLDEIRAFFALGKPPHPPSHHMTNCWVHEEDGRVRVKMKWICPDPRTGTMVVGDNDDWVVPTDAGWRIKERIAMIRYPGGFSGSGEG
ncbi:nuclear transport factor 2 family protein [Novosphingobium album (ex Liu et al. 2023)]|uniref:Nuclear transport factor 2 family protein n=1 Tax=Novosphingobium album (ex Liu et al. 2023) TaxID=3031130 RepID=A0ABT5WSF5_9SPHN|nr:nuclear transport factor 2 family protein [Novosphingobium album (ex Liu et al. 2023)]MDE8652981.1 nuclear transport factor 2 family protein [Novosphingobium album (ex Liu et al. 2023)]